MICITIGVKSCRAVAEGRAVLRARKSEKLQKDGNFYMTVG